ncbi:glycosyltransferase family 39 protein [Streptomyces microflavus]|uniref:Glycosyltransferase family 39 protein n=1 Tax=Streptomyces microflavus TaxID=1919 RepID=A0A7H8MR34_STRMI|nr:glycosyltransferase family 39 protein [Streptomyces microflavus]QKW44225.1 glycosyltransferase family 39 protein [Streptomyces microflavus]
MTTTTVAPPIPVPAPPERAGGPRWARPALYGLLLAVALAYFYNLSASGYANSFYSAAVQAGSQSWKALFFGSLDSANAITVDKPPAALWPMALSVRLFGLNSWAILAPQVLMGVATGAVLNTAVRRRFGPVAGLIAVGVFALTPVAALMFRFNNPDALLALLMTVTVWCVLRALEQGRTKWLLWAGAAVGFAFLTKTLQAFLILPPLAVLYAVCAPVPVRKRLGQLALSALTMVVAGGWWVAIVELMPASSRPYVGGSQNNSFLELTFGYNGLGRLNGEETGSVGGGGGGGGRGGGGWGETGIGRMFNSEVGGQIAWLLPAALILLVAGLWLTRKAGRTDSARAAFLAWGGALVMTAAVFSFMAGIFHQYYTVALAPYIAALVAMGVAVLWEERSAWWPRAVLAGTVVVTVVWAYVLLGRTPEYLPWLRWAVPVGGVVAALGLLVVGRFGGRGLALAVVGLSFAASLAAPTAYTLSTLNSGHQGSIVTAGPSGGGGMGGPGGGGRGGPGGFGGGGDDGRGQRAGAQPPGGQGQFPGQGQGQGLGQGGQQGNAPGGVPTAPGGTAPGGTAPGAAGEGGAFGGGGGGGMGGLLNGASVSTEAKALLEKDADAYTWAAAAVGAQNAAGYQLATGEPVMAIGGFNGSDPSPTLAQFKKYVAEGKVHYFVSGGTGGGMGGGGMGGEGMGGGGMGGGGNGTSSQISSWVTENFTEVTVGSATFYDLTKPVG